MTVGVVMISACTAKPKESGDGATARPPTTYPDTPAALADPAVGSASVPDDAGDGSNADIRSVKLTVDDKALTVVYELANALPTAGTAMLSVTAASQYGNQVRQLGVKWIDGTPQVFVFDFATSKQENLTVTPQRLGAAVTVAYPVSVIAGLGESFEWHAVSTIDGKDVDRAPDTDRAKFPELP